jgi:hypothetical protein
VRSARTCRASPRTPERQDLLVTAIGASARAGRPRREMIPRPCVVLVKALSGATRSDRPYARRTPELPAHRSVW